MPELMPVFDDQAHPCIREIMREALGCPECGAQRASLVALCEQNALLPRYVIACRECRFQGEFARSLFDAVKRWNSPAGFFKYFIKK